MRFRVAKPQNGIVYHWALRDNAQTTVGGSADHEHCSIEDNVLCLRNKILAFKKLLQHMRNDGARNRSVAATPEIDGGVRASGGYLL